jgi:hypothetical protein
MVSGKIWQPWMSVTFCGSYFQQSGSPLMMMLVALAPHLENTHETWDRCYDFLNIFAKKFSEKNGVFCSNYC